MQAKGLLFAFITAITIGLTSFQTSPTFAENPQQGTAPLEGKIVYFSEQNGEASRFDRSARGVSRYAGIISQLGATMETLEWNSGIPADTDMLIIPGPNDDFSPDQVARLWLFINNGGRVLIAADPLEFRNGEIRRNNRSLEAERGLFELIWPDFGIRADDNAIVSETDDPALAVPLTAEEPPADRALLNDQFTTSSINTSSEIMAGIEGNLFLDGARSVSLDATTPSLQTDPLFFTEGDVYGETDFEAYLEEGIATFDLQTDFDGANLPLAVSVADSATGARLVLLGDVDLINNAGGFQSSPPYSNAFVYSANVQMATQMTTWLLEAEAPTLNFPEAQPETTEAAPAATEESSSD